MRVVYGEQMRSIEEAAIREWQIPALLLMENAAMGAVKHILRMLKRHRDGLNSSKAKKAVILCGPGNNGGDGFAVARLLAVRGVDATVIFVGDIRTIKGDAKTNWEMLLRMGIPCMHYPTSHEAAQIRRELSQASIIVDALFGTGLTRAPQGNYAEMIEMMNTSGKNIVALDIPSGVNADNGQTTGVAVRAHSTITFGWMKAGLLLYPGAELAGRVYVETLSLPLEVWPTDGLSTMKVPPLTIKVKPDAKPLLSVLTSEEIPTLLPHRPKESHKGSFGRVRVMAGSRNMPGAAAISCHAAYKTGAGLVEACVIADVAQVIHQHLPEAITTVLPHQDGTLCLNSFTALFPEIKTAAAAGEVWLIGPGLGRGAAVTEFLRAALTHARCPLVLDADALNTMAEDLTLLTQITAPCIITPHPGEMSRLTGLSVTKITANPVETAVNFAQKHRVITLLKGARSVIAAPSGKAYINPTGSPALAKAGSGDALAGIIAGLLAQGTDAFISAALGAFLHGKAGEKAGESLSCYGVNARDIIDTLPVIMRRYS